MVGRSTKLLRSTSARYAICRGQSIARRWNLRYRLFRAIYPVFGLLFPNQVIRADGLARAMVDVAVWRTGERGGLVFENRDIRAMVESPHPRSEDPPGENGSQKTPR